MASVAGQERQVGRHLAHGVEFLTAIELVADVLGEDTVLLHGEALPAEGVMRSRRSG